MKTDKIQHFLAGILCASGVSLICAAFNFSSVATYIIAMLITIIVGETKELYDKFYPATHTCDVYDFMATFYGGLLGSCIIFLIRGFIIGL